MKGLHAFHHAGILLDDRIKLLCAMKRRSDGLLPAGVATTCGNRPDMPRDGPVRGLKTPHQGGCHETA